MPKKKILPQATLHEIAEFMQKRTHVSQTLIDRELEILRDQKVPQSKSEGAKSELSPDDVARLRREAQIRKMKREPPLPQTRTSNFRFVDPPPPPLSGEGITILDAEKAKNLSKQLPPSDTTKKGKQK